MFFYSCLYQYYCHRLFLQILPRLCRDCPRRRRPRRLRVRLLRDSPQESEAQDKRRNRERDGGDGEAEIRAGTRTEEGAAAKLIQLRGCAGSFGHLRKLGLVYTT